MTALHLTAISAAPVVTNTHRQLAEILYDVTADSTHTYEVAVHRLLDDMRELLASGRLDVMSYNAALATAVDVLFFFNYDPTMLALEEHVWYRASLIHQIGHGMLQALEKFRPDLSSKQFFCEAVDALSIGALLTVPTPLGCRRWTADA